MIEVFAITGISEDTTISASICASPSLVKVVEIDDDEDDPLLFLFVFSFNSIDFCVPVSVVVLELFGDDVLDDDDVIEIVEEVGNNDDDDDDDVLEESDVFLVSRRVTTIGFVIPTEILLMLEPFSIVDISVTDTVVVLKILSAVSSIKVVFSSSSSMVKAEIFPLDKVCASMKQQKIKSVGRNHVVPLDSTTTMVMILIIFKDFFFYTATTYYWEIEQETYLASREAPSISAFPSVPSYVLVYYPYPLHAFHSANLCVKFKPFLNM